MSGTIKIALAVIVALFVFGAIALVGLTSQQRAQDGGSESTRSNANATTDSDVATTLTYTGQGFEPNLDTVPVNSMVRIRNRSIRILQFVSDPYRDQTDNPELNVGELNPGESKTFYVSQLGRWGYHNALDPSETGVLLVQ